LTRIRAGGTFFRRISTGPINKEGKKLLFGKSTVSTLALAVGAGVVTALAAGPVGAHGLEGGSGFADGFLHPISGLDHVLVMVLAGLSAVHLGGVLRQRVSPPVTIGLAVVGGIILFHGLVHGFSTPSISEVGYGAGFLAATGFLLTSGLGLGLAFMEGKGGRFRLSARLVSSAAMAAAGFALIAL
jgi:urease accessory protein